MTERDLLAEQGASERLEREQTSRELARCEAELSLLEDELATTRAEARKEIAQAAHIVREQTRHHQT